MRPRRWTFSAALLGIAGLASIGLAVSSRLGWPWRYHLPPMTNDAARDSMRDPWTMTPWGPSVLFLVVGTAASYVALHRRSQSVGGWRRLCWFGLVLVVACVVATWTMVMEQNGI